MAKQAKTEARSHCRFELCNTLLTLPALKRAAQASSKLIQRSGRFEVVEIVASGEAALMAVERAAPDLVLLDLSLQGADGVRLLRSLRARGSDVEAIAVTATSAAGVVRTVLQLGAVDYLVKPFTPERLHEALGRFLHRVGAPRDGQLDQPQVDAITRGGPSRRRLPKGLAEKPLEAVRGALETETAWRSAEQIAARVAMARVTTRRYLEYLVTMREADVHRRSPSLSVASTSSSSGLPFERTPMLA